MNTSLEPKLAPPGAGLPWLELRLGRWWFALRRRAGHRDSFTARFERERETIRILVASCRGDDGARRVLIKRPRGLEDSSRFWSVWMTLDHLRIVHHAFARIIGALSNGVVPGGTASTAAVKPDPAVTAAVIGEYERSCDALLKTVSTAGNLETSVRYAHPWFGPLDAASWHVLSAGHMRIHRVQIERILAALPRSR